ncbi:MAG: PD-(D/E)XK nuclease family protein, partial [Dehalococcoidales bacterium]|nr:PD-(D/E)XK nuclease family protein [Dehalococcoidales bacterium]
PKGYPFNLNTAVDTLLKKEFDLYRASNQQHPLQAKYGLDAKPVSHAELNAWRANFTGIQYRHEPTGLTITGAIDDLWVNGAGEYMVVDYKATSKAEDITALDQDWQKSYKRQLEVYQWLLRRLGYQVSPTGYFVYANGNTDREAFDGKLEFDVTLIAHEGDDAWVEPAIVAAHDCLSGDSLPAAAADCDYCTYRDAVGKATKSLKS